MNTGKISGLISLVAGVAICLLATLFIGAGYASGKTQLTGAILGVGICGLVPLLILGGAGVYLLLSGKREEVQMQAAQKRERIVGMIEAQGRVPVDRIMAEMGMTQQDVKTAIYDLVNQGLFSGYINWEDMTFYSAEASQVGSTKCPNCGGIREFVGKGVVKCPYCGVELYLPPGAGEESK
ncbi:MAG: hypothetical protein D6755_06540 [Anaerolineae bacterium]|nr:MAG: hypothetical protein D6755_06540 [Anaerolineae bacterium]